MSKDSQKKKKKPKKVFLEFTTTHNVGLERGQGEEGEEGGEFYGISLGAIE